MNIGGIVSKGSASASRQAQSNRASNGDPAYPKGKVVRAARNAAQILQYLSKQITPLPLAKIARDLQIVPSTCLHTLHTLARENLVTHDPSRKEYVIGLGVLAMARGPALSAGDVSIVRPVIERVARAHDLTVSLWRPIADDRLLMVLAAFGPGSIRVHVSVGHTRSLVEGAAGRIAVAHLGLGTRALRRLFNAVHWARPISFEEYKSQIARARTRGWAVDERYLMREASSVAVPIFDAEGGFIMSCVGTMLATRYDEDAASRLAKDLISAASEIGRAAPAFRDR